MKNLILQERLDLIIEQVLGVDNQVERVLVLGEDNQVVLLRVLGEDNQVVETAVSELVEPT